MNSVLGVARYVDTDPLPSTGLACTIPSARLKKKTIQRSHLSLEIDRFIQGWK